MSTPVAQGSPEVSCALLQYFKYLLWFWQNPLKPQQKQIGAVSGRLSVKVTLQGEVAELSTNVLLAVQALSQRRKTYWLLEVVQTSTNPNVIETAPSQNGEVLRMAQRITLLLVCGTGFQASTICCWNLQRKLSYYCASYLGQSRYYSFIFAQFYLNYKDKYQANGYCRKFDRFLLLTERREFEGSSQKIEGVCKILYDCSRLEENCFLLIMGAGSYFQCLLGIFLLVSISSSLSLASSCWKIARFEAILKFISSIIMLILCTYNSSSRFPCSFYLSSCFIFRYISSMSSLLFFNLRSFFFSLAYLDFKRCSQCWTISTFLLGDSALCLWIYLSSGVGSLSMIEVAGWILGQANSSLIFNTFQLFDFILKLSALGQGLGYFLLSHFCFFKFSASFLNFQRISLSWSWALRRSLTCLASNDLSRPYSYFQGLGEAFRRGEELSLACSTLLRTNCGLSMYIAIILQIIIQPQSKTSSFIPSQLN